MFSMFPLYGALTAPRELSGSFYTHRTILFGTMVTLLCYWNRKWDCNFEPWFFKGVTTILSRLGHVLDLALKSRSSRERELLRRQYCVFRVYDHRVLLPTRPTALYIPQYIRGTSTSPAAHYIRLSAIQYNKFPSFLFINRHISHRTLRIKLNLPRWLPFLTSTDLSQSNYNLFSLSTTKHILCDSGAFIPFIIQLWWS